MHLFGSRAKGKYKQGSDIDLAVMNKGLDAKTIARAGSAFSESSLPVPVDLVDYNHLTNADFIEHINRVGILFYRADAPGL